MLLFRKSKIGGLKMKKLVWFVMLCLIAAAVVGASDKFSSHEEGDWKVEWTLVQDASNHKVYDVTVQNLQSTKRDFDLILLLDQMEFLLD